MIETAIVIAIVAAAAVFAGVNLFSKIRSINSAPKSGGCGGCGGCGGKCPGRDEKRESGESKQGSAMRLVATSAACAMALLLGVPAAQAADTVEGYAAGEVSFETHFAMEGFRDGRRSMGIGQEGLIGVGIHKYLSGAVGFSFGANGYLADVESAFNLSLTSTVLDTEHFDLDLMLAFDGTIAPGLELNFDIASFGVYVRAELPIAGIHRIPAEIDGDPYEATVGLGLTPGVYWTITEGHQLLLEASMEFFWADAEDASGRLDIWSLALGYNVMLLDNLELVTEVKTYQPTDEDVEFGFGVGIIASLP